MTVVFGGTVNDGFADADVFVIVIIVVVLTMSFISFPCRRNLELLLSLSLYLLL